jgi:signal transduction histidine kinase/DNA-binding response OmpR family regulator
MSTVLEPPVNILLVDDRPANLVALAAILEPLGARLVKATSGVEALRLLLTDDFALVLLDVQMPGMDGFAVAEAIKGHFKLRTVPLIFLTAISTEIEHVFRGYAVGAVDYLPKPFDPQILLAKAKVFIDLYQKEQRLRAQELSLRELTRHNQEIELAGVRLGAANAEREARVLASLNEGVFLLDKEGVVRLWNGAAERILGIPTETVMDRPLAEALPGWPATSHALDAGGGSGQAVPVDVGGVELWLSFSIVDIPGDRIYLFRDLTAEHAIERLKSDFVTTISHELRTPLTSVYGAAVTMRGRELAPERQEQMLDIIVAESSRLADLVDDILLAQRVDAGLALPNLEPVAVAPMVAAAVAAAELLLPENLELEIDLKGQQPIVQADAAQLRQVLTNLIDNAIKYSPGGGLIRVEAEVEDAHLQLVIRDQGLGIPPSEERRVFQKFHRLDHQMQRGISGTGLGLYICQQLVVQAGGRIWVEANPGGGSLFTVEMPLASQASAPAAHSTSAQS